MSEEKMNFARTLNESGQHGFITSDECFHYGSMSGCDEYCPVLLRGECRNADETLSMLSKDNDIEFDLWEELKDLYNFIEESHD